MLDGDGWTAEIHPPTGSPRHVPIVAFILTEDKLPAGSGGFRLRAQVWHHAERKLVDPAEQPGFQGFYREGLNSEHVRVPVWEFQ